MNNTILVELENNKPTTSSLKVAEYFKKDHSKILRDIKNVLVFVPESSANFGLCDYIGENGQSYPMYKLNKTAFTLLAMGFTGAKATKFKLDYIKAFDEMETQLANLIVKQEPKQINRKELALMVIAQEEELEKLALENTKLATRDLKVKTQKDYKWKKQELKDDMGRTINWYVGRKFYTNNWKTAHDKAKKAYRINTGVDLPTKIDLASIEMKKSYLQWLSMYEVDNG